MVLRPGLRGSKLEAWSTTGRKLGSLPPAVALLIFVTSPDYMAPLFNDPRGHILLMIGGFWMTLGVLSMRKMINFKL